MTANLRLEGDPVQAQHIPTDTMVLDDNGVLGVRVVGENRKVRFYPVQIIEDEGDGVWVSGLPDQVRLIVEGQDFVSTGSPVEWVLDQAGNTP